MGGARPDIETQEASKHTLKVQYQEKDENTQATRKVLKKYVFFIVVARVVMAIFRNEACQRSNRQNSATETTLTEKKIEKQRVGDGEPKPKSEILGWRMPDIKRQEESEQIFKVQYQRKMKTHKLPETYFKSTFFIVVARVVIFRNEACRRSSRQNSATETTLCLERERESRDPMNQRQRDRRLRPTCVFP